MSYAATVLKVMIGSPSDVQKERRTTHSAIHEWNAIHSQNRRQVLMPLAWEHNSAPALDGRPQAVINRQLTKDSDLLVAIFWTRLGSPTGTAPSGTVEEIREHLREGKPVMLYFSNEPVRADSIDDAQYKALLEFKTEMMKLGLVETYETLEEFREKFARQLAQTVIERFPVTGESASREPLRPRLNVEDRENIGLLSADARELLDAAAKDRNGAIFAVESMAGWSIETNGRNFVQDHNRRSEARWRSALTELVNAGLVESRGDGSLQELTHEGFRAADLLSPAAPSADKKQQLLSLLHQTRLITHELPREQSKGEQIRGVILWPDADAALLRELAVPFGTAAANLGAEAHRHLGTIAAMVREVQQTPRERGYQWNRFDWSRWIAELDATERTLTSLATVVDPHWAALV